MTQPHGPLTPVQVRIMEAVWAGGSQGRTVAEIWQAIRLERNVGRTTILRLLDRLWKRGWLLRRKGEGGNHYVVAQDRQHTMARLAGEFVENFFDGSASQLMMSLLGSRRIRKDELDRLRKLLEDEGSGQ